MITHIEFSLREAQVALDNLLQNQEALQNVAKAAETAKTMSPDQHLVICLSGRGDKDAAELARLRGQEW